MAGEKNKKRKKKLKPHKANTSISMEQKMEKTPQNDVDYLSGGSHGRSYACHSSLYFFSLLEILTPNGFQTSKILLKKKQIREYVIIKWKQKKKNDICLSILV